MGQMSFWTISQLELSVGSDRTVQYLDGSTHVLTAGKANRSLLVFSALLCIAAVFRWLLLDDSVL